MAQISSLSEINPTGSTSFLGGVTQSSFTYGGQNYSYVAQPGEDDLTAINRVLGAGKSDTVNRDPTTGLVGPNNTPIQDWASQVGGGPDAGVPAGYSASEGLKPGFNGNYTNFQGSTPGGSAPVKASTMTKDQFAQILEAGSNPSNTPTNVPTSSGYAASKAIEALIPQKQAATGATSPDPNAPFPNLGPQPQPFDATTAQTELSSQYGLDSLLTQQTSIQDQISQIQNDLLTQQENLQAQGGVSSRVLSKEVSVATKSANQQLRSLRLQQTEITRSISVANKGISMAMSALKTDYANAKAQWQFDYAKNTAYYNTLDKTSTAADKNDKVNLQNMLNMLGTGKVNITDLTPDAQNTIDELIMKQYGSEFLGMQNELSSGTAIYRKSFTGANGKKYMQTLYENPDGTYKTEYTTPAPSAASQRTTQANDQVTSMSQALSSVTGSDGYVSPDDYLKARNAWEAQGLNPTTFDTKMKGFRNPANPNYVTTSPTTAASIKKNTP